MKAKSFPILAALALLSHMSAGICIAGSAGPFYPIEVNGLWGYMDQEGKVVIKPQFEGAADFSEGLAPVKTNGLWGYLDQKLNIRIEPRFQEVRDFSEGLAAVHLDGKWGYIDQEGQFVIGPTGKYERLGDFSEGMARADIVDNTSGNKWVYFDKSQNQSMVYPFAKDFSEGLAAAYITNTWGYLDKDFETVFKVRFNSITGLWSEDVAGSFSEGLAWVHSGFGEGYEKARYGYVDGTGKMAIPYQFIKAGDFSEGLARVKVEEGWGYIDKTGKTIIKPQFDEAGDFLEGLAGVKMSAKWGFINSSGSFVIAPQFDQVAPFKNSLARVRMANVMAYLNKEGKVIWAAK